MRPTSGRIRIPVTEAEKARHTAEMIEDMMRHDADLAADYAAQRAYYKKSADAERVRRT